LIVETEGDNGLPKKDKHQDKEDKVGDHNDYQFFGRGFANNGGRGGPPPPDGPFCRPGTWWC